MQTDSACYVCILVPGLLSVYLAKSIVCFVKKGFDGVGFEWRAQMIAIPNSLVSLGRILVWLLPSRM
jgi:hypothetical protein